MVTILGSIGIEAKILARSRQRINIFLLVARNASVLLKRKLLTDTKKGFTVALVESEPNLKGQKQMSKVRIEVAQEIITSNLESEREAEEEEAA